MTNQQLDQEELFLKAYCIYMAEVLAWNTMVELKASWEVMDTIRMYFEIGVLPFHSGPRYHKVRLLSFKSWREYYVFDEI